jgi:MFS family permease
VSSFLVGKFLVQLGGRNNIIFVATVMIITQSFILGMLEYVEDKSWFLILSFIAQAFGGFGAGANSTSSMAILSSFP